MDFTTVAINWQPHAMETETRFIPSLCLVQGVKKSTINAVKREENTEEARRRK